VPAAAKPDTGAIIPKAVERFIKMYGIMTQTISGLYQGPHVQGVAYTLFHVNDQMYQERNDRGNVWCLTQTSGLSYALFYSY